MLSIAAHPLITLALKSHNLAASRLPSEGDRFNKRKKIFSPALFISSFVES